MSAKKIAWTGFAVAAALILAFYFTAQNAGTQAGADSATTEESQDPAPAASASPSGTDLGNGFSQTSPDAPQAPEHPTPVQYERQVITAPSLPAPDTQDAAAVAQAFLTVYNYRKSETDTSWQEKVQPWLVPDLAVQLPNLTNGALEGKAPAAVSAIEIGENVKDWGVDTPLRWSRHVQVVVDTQDQGTYRLSYRVQAQLTDQGWLINTAQLDRWQRVEK